MKIYVCILVAYHLSVGLIRDPDGGGLQHNQPATRNGRRHTPVWKSRTQRRVESFAGRHHSDDQTRIMDGTKVEKQEFPHRKKSRCRLSDIIAPTRFEPDAAIHRFYRSQRCHVEYHQPDRKQEARKTDRLMSFGSEMC